MSADKDFEKWSEVRQLVDRVLVVFKERAHLSREAERIAADFDAVEAAR
jgi:hypothetical protein